MAIPPCAVCCTVNKVELRISKTPLTLKHDNKADLEVVVTPGSANVSATRIEIRRASGTAWCVLARARVIKPHTFVIAGFFKLRAISTVCGTEYTSAEVDLEVRFPTYAQITADPTVLGIVNGIWAQNLAMATSATTFRELGTWIELDTASDTYGSSGTTIGQATTINLPLKQDVPANPSPCDSGAKYYVASFHTHPTAAFIPTTFVRPIGPSSGDTGADTFDQVPGIVYDYVAVPAGTSPTGPGVPGGHPTNSPAMLYLSLGVDPRPTPP